MKQESVGHSIDAPILFFLENHLWHYIWNLVFSLVLISFVFGITSLRHRSEQFLKTHT